MNERTQSVFQQFLWRYALLCVKDQEASVCMHASISPGDVFALACGEVYMKKRGRVKQSRCVCVRVCVCVCVSQDLSYFSL